VNAERKENPKRAIKTARKEKMQRANQRQHKYCKITDSFFYPRTGLSIFNLLTVREVESNKLNKKVSNQP
jgi:hypothetical protein